jgi:hypothetical protein
MLFRWSSGKKSMKDFEFLPAELLKDAILQK